MLSIWVSTSNEIKFGDTCKLYCTRQVGDMGLKLGYFQRSQTRFKYKQSIKNGQLNFDNDKAHDQSVVTPFTIMTSNESHNPLCQNCFHSRVTSSEHTCLGSLLQAALNRMRWNTSNRELPDEYCSHLFIVKLSPRFRN